MELSRKGARLVERVNNLTAGIESMRQERGIEEARRAAVRSWINYHVSLKRFYGQGDIARALAGSSDLEKFKSITSGVGGQFMLIELNAAGVSDEGIIRVITQASPLGSSYGCKPCWCKCSGLCLVVSQEEFEEYQDNLEQRGGNDA